MTNQRFAPTLGKTIKTTASSTEVIAASAGTANSGNPARSFSFSKPPREFAARTASHKPGLTWLRSITASGDHL